MPRCFFSFSQCNCLIAVPLLFFWLAQLLDCRATVYFPSGAIARLLCHNLFLWLALFPNCCAASKSSRQLLPVLCRGAFALALSYSGASRLLYFLWLWLGCSSAHVRCCHHDILLQHALAVASQQFCCFHGMHLQLPP
jgi:hypothetical protein